MTQNEPNDAELVRQTLAGDRDAFGRLYDRYSRLVRAVAYTLAADGPAVEDMAQESFLRAYCKLSTLREPERFGAWLVGIARQVSREKKRRWLRERHKFAGTDVKQITAVDGRSKAIEDAEEVDWILTQMSQLGERERIAITVFFFQECQPGKTAELLGLSRSGMYALVARAVAQLSKLVCGRDPKGKANR